MNEIKHYFAKKGDLFHVPVKSHTTSPDGARASGPGKASSISLSLFLMDRRGIDRTWNNREKEAVFIGEFLFHT